MVIVGLCYLALALFDAWYTNKRMPQIGLAAEMNPLIRGLSRRFGNKIGIYSGVLIPTMLLVPLGFHFHSLLIYLLGCRTTLAAFQLKVLLGENATKRAREKSVPFRSNGLCKGPALL